MCKEKGQVKLSGGNFGKEKKKIDLKFPFQSHTVFIHFIFKQEKQEKSQSSDIENIYFCIISPHKKNSYF